MPLEVVDGVGTPLAGAAGAMTSVQHACAWDASGNLSCWGHGEGGRLGYGGAADQPAPIAVSVSGVQRVSSQYRHTCALVAGGGLYCWGYDTSGELGDGGSGNQYSPVTVHGPGGVGVFTAATDLGTGDSHTCASRTDGTVWCWGNGANGRLGTGATGGTTNIAMQAALPVPVQSVAVSNRSTCALSMDGLEVWCWGYGADGELGTGGSADSDTPLRALVGCPSS
jgi:alpha-tubulin suppressor-like RCC1 family protein